MAEGHSTGLVLDSGDGVSHVIPVVDGQVTKHAVARLNLAGRHVTKYLVKLLLMRGYAFNSSADFETVREIKEQMCFVSYDRFKDRKLAEETTLLDKEYKLPDGTVMSQDDLKREDPAFLYDGVTVPIFEGYYEYIATYVDDLTIGSKDPHAIITYLTDVAKFKLKGTDPINYLLGCDYWRDDDGTLCSAPKKYIE